MPKEKNYKTIQSFFSSKRKIDEVTLEDDQSSKSPKVSASSPPPNIVAEAEEISNNLEEEEEQVDNRVEHIFRGIEFLERDSGLRLQIWKYPIAQRDDVQRVYLLNGPMQPQLAEYKRSGKKGHQRRFQFSWFSQFPSWLEYSVSKDAAYCFVCYLFGNNSKKRYGYNVFTVKGFNCWKRVNDGKNCAFLTHVGFESSTAHNNTLRVIEIYCSSKNI